MGLCVKTCFLNFLSLGPWTARKGKLEPVMAEFGRCWRSKPLEQSVNNEGKTVSGSHLTVYSLCLFCHVPPCPSSLSLQGASGHAAAVPPHLSGHFRLDKRRFSLQWLTLTIISFWNNGKGLAIWFHAVYKLGTKCLAFLHIVACEAICHARHKLLPILVQQVLKK